MGDEWIVLCKTTVINNAWIFSINPVTRCYTLCEIWEVGRGCRIYSASENPVGIPTGVGR
ncbi:hypothetical protein LPTSP1_32520 [Leptospira johnsonii]|uniref:Uncharacterized protein n=1 Tax=Leptospira johnsonii TaxID=1917820 RepID=A0A2P2D6N0_9LEPT|nr:hypothetical protein LPTSP1_32520 [Leptospira johnsonii]